MKTSPYYRCYWLSVFLLLLVVIPLGVRGWDEDDVDNDAIDRVVNVVKDMKMNNFYDMMGLSQNASQ